MKSTPWALSLRSLVVSPVRPACFCAVLFLFTAIGRGQDFYIFSTLAGKANAGYLNGVGLAAKFSAPRGMALDAAGNIFVVEEGNHDIRKIAPDGTVTTFAGTPGWPGNVDGPANQARFVLPRGLAMDGAGNLYVAEGDHTIRKITPSGIVSTVAGLAGVAGADDGVGSAARFNSPYGVAVDAAGANIYVSDTLNQTIRHITADGSVTTLAGSAGVQGNADGTGSTALFRVPQGMVVAPDGNVFVADNGNRVIKIVSPAGVVVTYAGGPGTSGIDGFGPDATFSGSVVGLAFDAAGNLFVADGSRIRKIVPPVAPETRPYVSTIAGSAISGYADGSGSAALFRPVAGGGGLVVDAAGNLFVADRGNQLIRRLTFVGSEWSVTTFAGTLPTVGNADGSGEAARFNSPSAVALDGAGNAYISDGGNCTIRKVTPGGEVSTFAGSAGLAGSADGNGANARFNAAQGLAFDAAGNLFVADSSNNTIRKIAPNGDVSTFAGIAGSPVGGSVDGNLSTARFVSPWGITVAADGVIYVAEGGGKGGQIRKIATDGQVTTIAGGTLGFGVSVDGNGLAAGFNNPWALVTDNAGHLYIAERSAGKLRKLDLATGDVTTLYQTSTTGIVCGIAIDSTNNIYLSQSSLCSVIKYAYDGTVTTLGGLASASGSADGVGEHARFLSPFGLAVMSSGTLYIADTGNNTIRKGTPVHATNTPAGSDVIVAPEPVDENGDPAPGAPTVVAIYTTVSIAGETTASITADGPDLPAGFRFGKPSFFIDLHTTASFSGMITVSINYSGLTFDGASEDLALLHFQNGGWEDITTGNDTALCIISGETDSLSPFVVLRAVSPRELLADLSEQVAALDANNGTIRKLQAGLQKIERALSGDKAKKAANATPLLRDFIGDVEKMKGKHISATQADGLILLAEEIIKVLP